MAALERVWVCDTVTGARLNVLPVSDFTWGRCLNEGSSGQATVPVRDATVRMLDLPSLIAERTNTLVYEVGGLVVAAGVIEGTSYDHAAGTLRVDHSDIWAILDGRLTVPHGVANVMVEKLVYGPLSLGTIAKRVVQEAISPGGWYSLPIVFPADVAGTDSRTYYGYSMQLVTDTLKELMESDGGPDIDFAPRWSSSGSLEWVMRAAPGLSSAGSWEYNLDAARSAGLKLSASTDTSRFSNNAYAVGEGTEKKTLYRSNPSADHSRPAAEAPTSFKGVTSLGVLGQLAVERSRALSKPTKQYVMTVLKADSPGVTDLSLGDTVRLYAAADPWLPSGYSSHRLIKFTGSLGPEVRLEYQPTGA